MRFILGVTTVTGGSGTGRQGSKEIDVEGREGKWVRTSAELARSRDEEGTDVARRGPEGAERVDEGQNESDATESRGKTVVGHISAFGDEGKGRDLEGTRGKEVP